MHQLASSSNFPPSSKLESLYPILSAAVEALTEELQKMLLEQTDIDSERLIEIQNRLQELTGK